MKLFVAKLQRNEDEIITRYIAAYNITRAAQQLRLCYPSITVLSIEIPTEETIIPTFGFDPLEIKEGESGILTED